jgi:hypothetical protein
VAEVVERLCVFTRSLYKRVKAIKLGKSDQQAAELVAAKSEVLTLKGQLRRTEEERNIPKKAALDSIGQCIAAGSSDGDPCSRDDYLALRGGWSVILRSDRGTQFRSVDYQKYLKRNTLICSMSAVVHCGDNAAYEGLFGALRRERVNRQNTGQCI